MGFIGWIANRIAGVAGSDRALKQEYKELEKPKNEFIRAVREFDHLYGVFEKKYFGKLHTIPPKKYAKVVALVDKLHEAERDVLRYYMQFTSHMFRSLQVLDHETFTIRAAHAAETRKVSDDEVRRDMAHMLKQVADEYKRGVIATNKELEETLTLIKKLERKTA